MGWTTPRDWVAGEIVTASLMNTHIRDNESYLKGIGQVPSIQSGLTIDNSLGSERLLLPLLSTAECTTVLNATGEVAFDEQTYRAKIFDNDGVESLVSTADVDDTPANGAATDPISSNWAFDHEAAADPHTGYVLESLADAQGDIFYAAGDNAWTRLAKGTAGQRLRINAGATDPEWADPGTTMEIFAPAFPYTSAAAGPMGVRIDDPDTDLSAFATLLVPQDFTTITAIQAIVIPMATGANMHLSVMTTYGAYNGGENYYAHTEEGNNRDIGATTTYQFLAHSISDLVDVSALAAGDILSVTLVYSATAVATNLYFKGLRLKYT